MIIAPQRHSTHNTYRPIIPQKILLLASGGLVAMVCVRYRQRAASCPAAGARGGIVDRTRLCFALDAAGLPGSGSL